MTIFIMLGIAAIVWLAILILELMPLALPISAGLSATLLLVRLGTPSAPAILTGLAVAVLALAAAQALFRAAGSDLVRAGLAAAFVIPAALAGYCGVTDLARLALGDGCTLVALGLIGGGLVSRAAFLRLAGELRA